MANKCHNCENQKAIAVSDEQLGACNDCPAEDIGDEVCEACAITMYSERIISIGGVYHHFKGNTYKVLDVVTNADDLELYVVYELLEYGTRWVRSYKDFVSRVDREKYPEATQEYKFELEEQK